MRELKMTGYCKHISRLCTGWFLISDLGLDWRMGGEWFESILVDYEPTLNWFNWVCLGCCCIAFRMFPCTSSGTRNMFKAVMVLNHFDGILKRYPRYGCLEPINPHKPQSQGQQQCREILEAGVVHDPDATYIKRWIPELSSLLGCR